MLEAISKLLLTYKYWIVIGGALLEGETLLLLAGGSAYHGHINLYLVVLIAFLGAVIHDHVLFFVGRYAEEKIISKFPKIDSKVQKISQLFERYENWFILGFRFVYGIRTITPIILGTTHIKLKKYSLMTVIAALLWAASIAYIGYSCALMIEAISDMFIIYQKYLTMAILTLIGCGAMIYKWRHKKKRNNTKPQK